MLKFLRIPFGQSGDRAAVPDPVEPTGEVSYTEGYGIDYARPKTDPLSKNIEREKMNQLFFDATAAIGELQAQGVPDFITSVLNGGSPYSYAAGACVKYTDGFLYVSLVSSNTALPTDPTKWARYDNILDGTKLASTASSTVGAGLIGYLRNIAGAVATTLYAWLQRREVDAEDFASVQAALNAPLVSIVNLTLPAYNLAAGLTIPTGVTLRGRGKAKTAITLTADITPFTFTDTNDSSVKELLVIAHAAQTAPMCDLNAATVTMARNLVENVQFSGSATDFALFRVRATGVDCGNWKNNFKGCSASGFGTIVEFITTALNSWTNSNTVDDLYANDYIRGVTISTGGTAADGCSDSLFNNWGCQTSPRTLIAGANIPNSTFGINRRNHFNDVRLYDLTGAATAYFIGTGVDRTEITGATGDSFTAQRFTDNGVDTIRPGNPEFLADLIRRGRYQPIPTVAGWATTLTGSATVTAAAAYLQLRTGVALSVARADTDAIAGFGAPGGTVLTLDWGRKFILSFGVARVTSEPLAVGRVQLKQVRAGGGLAAAGIGIQINNFTMAGESYGSALATVALGVMPADATQQITIINYPGQRVEWWVNGRYVAQQTNAANLPVGVVTCYLNAILGNNAATDVQMFVTQPSCWSEQ